MGRKGALPSGTTIVADSRRRRDDSSPATRQIAQRRIRVADVQKIRHHPPARPVDLPAAKPDKSSPQVIDNLPQSIPVLERELEVIEMYLGALIDKMLHMKE